MARKVNLWGWLKGRLFRPAGDWRKGKTEVYPAKDGWRLRIKAGNGEIVGHGTRAYKDKALAVDIARGLRRHAFGFAVRDVPSPYEVIGEFVYRKAKDGFRFRLYFHQEQVVQGEAYTAEAGVLNGCMAVKNALDSGILYVQKA